ncbi:MAG: MFS transporter [Dehalococcoidia bacterium]|nr:MFS transporter [Dehalococcoidia bacterium]
MAWHALGHPLPSRWAEERFVENFHLRIFPVPKECGTIVELAFQTCTPQQEKCPLIGNTRPSAESLRTASPAAVPEAPAPRRPAAAGRFLDPFKERDFTILWFSMLTGMTAMGMQMVAMGYLTYSIAGTATALGAVTVAWGVPQLLFCLVGGVVADRFPKRNLLVMSQGAMAIVALINTILVATGLIQIWHLAALGLVQGTVFAFNMPARQALVPAIVGLDRLANAVALNNAGMNLTRIVGPSLAGILIGIPAIGIAGVYMATAVLYLAGLLLLLKLPKDRGGRGQPMRGSMATQLTSGLRYIGGNPALQTLLMAAFAVVLLGMPYQSLLPLFALQVHNVGSEGLGLLSGVAGSGALAGFLVVAYVSASPRKDRILIASGAGFGLSLVLFALSPTYPLALVMMFLVGVLGNIYMALNNTLVMVNTDSSMHGRVMSVYMMTFALMPLSTLPMSMIADVIGAPYTIAGAGALAAVAVTATAMRSRRRTTLS